MNNTAKNLIRVVGVVAGLGAAVWALRDKLLPTPEAHTEPPPRFRTGIRASDDLTEIKGIGPVTATKLAESGISTFDQLAAMTPVEVAAAAGTSEATASVWIDSASTFG
ncbi:MAG: helix-hairpin-helix domain-containing protein [Actinomycetia bacterium]|nr:helix-hairpin-helix domain-containing protein [Actinomycetes bacterium]